MPDHIAIHLRVKSIFGDSHVESVKLAQRKEEKALKVIQILKQNDSGKMGMRLAFEYCGASSLYSDVFGQSVESSIDLSDVNRSLSHATPGAAQVFTEDCSSLYPRTMQFITQLKSWYDECYLADTGINGRMNERVDEIYVPLVWQNQFEPGVKTDLAKVVDLLYKDKTKVGRVALISGAAGMGKTTVVKIICHRWLNKDKDCVPLPFRLVIVLPLRYVEPNLHDTVIQSTLHYYNTNYRAFFPNLDDLAIREIDEYCSDPKYAKDILFLIDGFDEYVGNNAQIGTLSRSSGFDPNFRSALIVTSRPLAIHSIQTRHYFTLAGFDWEHIKEFITKQAITNADALLGYIQDGPAAVLAVVPLLLQMICAIWDGNSLPSSKRTLYDKFRDFSLLQIDENDRKIDPRDAKEPGCTQRFIDGGEVAFSELMSTLGGNLVIDGSEFNDRTLRFLLKIGFLQFHDPGQQNRSPIAHAIKSSAVMFRHKSFQEYLAAIYMESKIRSGNALWKWVKKTFLCFGFSINNYTSYCIMAPVWNTIHICRNSNDTLFTASVDLILICHITSTTSNQLESALTRSKFDPDHKIVINASEMCGTDEDTLIQVLNILIKHTQEHRAMEVHLIMSTTSLQTMYNYTNSSGQTGLDSLMKSIKTELVYILIRGTSGTSVMPVELSIKLTTFACLMLDNLAMKSEDLSKIIKAVCELDRPLILHLRETSLTSDELEQVCRECTSKTIKFSRLALRVQPRHNVQLTDECLLHLIQLNLFLQTDGICVCLQSVNNFSVNPFNIAQMFVLISQRLESEVHNKPTYCIIQLIDCGLRDEHADLIVDHILQMEDVTLKLILDLSLNRFSVRKLPILKCLLTSGFRSNSRLYL